jgi:hypothetical protein
MPSSRMAKVLGESGRYVSQEAINQSRKIVLLVLLIVAILAVIEGFIIASFISIGQWPPWVRTALLLIVLIAIIILTKWGEKKLGALQKRRDDMRRGAAGEIHVGNILADFPDDFCIVNDLTTPFGNLDHVVVGPTGVFVLDTKSWRGVVTTDGKGELLVNRKPTEKHEIRQFVGRMLGVRDKVRTLAPGCEAFYQPLFVFTAARVEAKWGTTGSVHCVRDDQLNEYIVQKDFGKRLRPDEVQRIAQAFLGLAHMDREFAQAQ